MTSTCFNFFMICTAAERQASPAAGSRSDAGAKAGGSQVQALVGQGLGHRLSPCCSLLSIVSRSLAERLQRRQDN